jgi:hypothetical protein
MRWSFDIQDEKDESQHQEDELELIDRQHL